jgi:hypothetical protein
MPVLIDPKRQFKAARRELGVSPMRRLLRQIAAHDVKLSHRDALEVFGHTGEFHTLDYASRVRSLEIWEIRAECEPALRRNLPDATVKITDSFQEIKQVTGRYGLVVVENPMSNRGGGYCEHFDIIDDAFRVAADDSVLIVNVVPEASRKALRRWPELFNPTQLARRREFYGTGTPERLSPSRLAAHYRGLAEGHGFRVGWTEFRPRRDALSWSNPVCYLALGLVR